MRGPVADAEHRNRLLVDRVPSRRVMDVVVVGVMAGRREGLAIAGFEVDAALASLVNVAPDDAVPLAAVDLDRPIAHVTDCAGHDARHRAPPDQKGVCRVGLDRQAAKGDVRTSLSRAMSRTTLTRTLPEASGARRPEVENRRIAVQVPFARAIQFRQKILGIEPLAAPHREGSARFGPEADRAHLGVDAGEWNTQVGPIPDPKAVEPDLSFAPAGWAGIVQTNFPSGVATSPVFGLPAESRVLAMCM